MHKHRHAAAYRQTLLHILEDRCSHNPRYSQRAFARDIGIAAHRVSEILRGRQGLSARSATMIAERLGMDRDSRRDFIDRVVAAHGRSGAQRQAASERLRRAGKDAEATRSLDLAKFRAIADWYHLAIVEALKLSGCDGTVKDLATRLAISQPQVRAATRRLEELGLIRRRTDGSFEAQRDSAIGDNLPSLAVQTFHKQVLEKAAQALVLQPIGQRDFNTLFFAADIGRLPEMLQRIASFVAAMNQEFGLEAGDSANAVYGFATQLFRIDEGHKASITSTK